MQKDVNNGQVIIGVYKNVGGGSGHIVIMMPDKLYEEKESDDKVIELGNDKKLDRPISLECGSADKRIKPSDHSSLAEFKWFKYNP
ncbi:MAG: hypothetical protein K8R31_12305 [Bacteroidales bacterium]|nr:hypothetical protein [Bacteroidales bacterium]